MKPVSYNELANRGSRRREIRRINSGTDWLYPAEALLGSLEMENEARANVFAQRPFCAQEVSGGTYGGGSRPAVTAPGFGPDGFSELLMSQGSDDQLT